MSYLPKIPTSPLLEAMAKLRERDEALRAFAEPLQTRLAALDALTKPFLIPRGLNETINPFHSQLLEQLAENERLKREGFAPLQVQIETLARAVSATAARGGLAELLESIKVQQETIGSLAGRFAEHGRMAQLTAGRFLDERERALDSFALVNSNLAAMIERQRPELEWISRSAELARLAEGRIAALRFDPAAGFDAIARDAAAARLSTFADSYRHLTDWVSSQPEPFELPSFLTERPAHELLDSADVLHALSMGGRKARSEDVERYIDPHDTPLPDMLAELHPELARMLRGSRRVLRDVHNEDRERQWASSVIQLFEHMLRLAAPDEDVKRWAGSRPEHYTRDGRLTRRARWGYLTQNLPSGAASRWDPIMQASRDEIIGILKELQTEKHGLERRLSVDVVEILIARADGALRTLYGVWRFSRRESR